MFENHRKYSSFPSVTHLLVVATGIFVLPFTAAAQESQDSPLAVLPPAIGTATVQPDGESLSLAASYAQNRRNPVSESTASVTGGGTASSGKESARFNRVRRITLEQVQQNADRALLPAMSRLGQLSIEATKQHRLGVQADYFPKFGATFANLHTSEFMGQYLAVRRPRLGLMVDVPIQIINQNTTIANVTLTQPFTPLFEVKASSSNRSRGRAYRSRKGWFGRCQGSA